MGQLIYLKDVVTLRLDQKKCTGCGMCLLVCPRAVLSLNDSKVDIVNRDACMECGACARNCSVNAFSVRPGVGCAAAVINSMLGRRSSSSRCTTDTKKNSGGCTEFPQRPTPTGCC